MAQFTCNICDQGFEQKSHLERHMITSHPQQAPSAADVEKALSGIQYPKSKQDLVQYVSQKISTIGKDLFDLIDSLPTRTYRDSADVAIALGELKSGKGIRTAEEISKSEQPSRKGGRAAATIIRICSQYCKSSIRHKFSKEKKQPKRVRREKYIQNSN